MKHTAPEAHDGYATHNHRIQQNHSGVARTPVSDDDILTPEQHAAEASRLLWVIDDMLQDDNTPRSLLDLAVIALAHGVTALSVDTFTGNTRLEGEAAPEPGWNNIS